jgi:hypothetical protein
VPYTLPRIYSIHLRVAIACHLESFSNWVIMGVRRFGNRRVRMYSSFKFAAAGLLLSAPFYSSHGAEMPASPRASPVMDMQTFWTTCDQRGPNGTRTDLCRGYVGGVVDSVVSLAEGRSVPRICHTADSQEALLERVIRYVPARVRDDSKAAYHVQIAVLRAMLCE